MSDLGDLSWLTLFGPENRTDPHPLYHRMRAERPLFQDPVWNEFILTRWADCDAVLRDPRWSSDPRHRLLDFEIPADDPRVALASSNVKILLFLDPPDHTRLRRLVSKVFTPNSVERLRPHIQELANSLLDDAVESAGSDRVFDVLSAVGYPLPVIVICELLGVPVEDRDQFGGWSSDAARLLDGDIDEPTAMRGVVAAANFLNYFNGLFEERRARPQDDLVSGLLAAEDDGDRLSEEELRSIVLLLFIVGHETTMNLIGNGLFALLRHREQFERLLADPDLAPSAVEECLRYDGPVHATARIATEDLEVGGQAVTKGQQVVALLAAANRDPARFPEPDRFDIGRPDNQHLTFSLGIHYCLGAALARLEGQVVFGTIAKRFPKLELASDDISYREHLILRGLKALPVTW